MANYVVLANFTDQGMRTIKDTVGRSDTVREAAKRYGCTMKEIFWVQGQYDIVTLVEGDDEQALSAFGLWLASQGNVKLQTLRAFTRDEMSEIVKKMI